MTNKISEDDIKKHSAAFWVSLERQWPIIYEAIVKGTNVDRERVLQLLHYFAGPLTDYIDFEITLGELNRVVFDSAKSIVELYISPRLLKENIPIMEAIYSAKKSINNLQVYKYRSYNLKDPLIATIEYEDATFAYTDFGCQHFIGLSEEKKPIINIVLYVRKDAAAKLLTQKEVTFLLPDKSEQKIMKWLPTKMNAVDVLLTNIIGEYNLIHRTGYIEFLPEGDPLIATGSVFTELSDLRGAYAVLDKIMNITKCVVCNRQSYQCNIKRCSKCKNVKYCCKQCQIIDFPTHKTMCV
jgi:hypothetical protein